MPEPMLRTLAARLSRDLGVRLLRLAEHLASDPEEALQRRKEALLRERFPDAPEHWLQLVAAGPHGPVMHHKVVTPPAPHAGAEPAPATGSTGERVEPVPSAPAAHPTPERHGSQADDLPRPSPTGLPASPTRRRQVIAVVADPPHQPTRASAPDCSPAGARLSAPGAVVGRRESRRRPAFAVVESQPRERAAPAAPCRDDTRASQRTDAAPPSFAVAASRAHWPIFVEASAAPERRAASSGPAWAQAEQRPTVSPAWPALVRSSPDLDLPPAEPARRRPPEAAFAEPTAAAAAPWPELPQLAERHDPPTDRQGGADRERLLRLARDQERL